MANIGVTARVAAVGPSNIPVAAYSNAFVVGQTPWGESNVVKICSSFTDWLRLFGGFNRLVTLAADGSADTWGTETDADVLNTYHSVKAYFDEKGVLSDGVLYFVRVNSTTPTVSSRTFPDSGANNTTITSKWKGTPGSTTTVKIKNIPAAGTFAEYCIITLENAQAGISETWTIATAIDAASASKASQLCTIALPAGGQIPVTVSSAQKLGNGTAATADDYAATAAQYVGTTTGANVKTGLQAFTDMRYGTGFVWAPGKSGDATWRAGLKTHVDNYKRTAPVSADSGKTLSSVISDQTGVAGSENCAYYWPQVYVSDQASTTGGVRLVGNEGAIAGLAARLDRQFGGPHKSPAGINYSFKSIIDVERQSSGQELCDDAGSNTVADATAYVNTLRVKNQAIVSWGLRTQASDERLRQINAVRVVQLVYHSCYGTVEKYTFEPIDPFGNLFARVRGDLNGFLHRLYRDGILYGTEPGAEPKSTDAYMVTCDTGNNTPETIRAGQLIVDVAIVPTLNAEQARFTINVASPGAVRASA